MSFSNLPLPLLRQVIQLEESLPDISFLYHSSLLSQKQAGLCTKETRHFRTFWKKKIMEVILC